MQNLEEWQKEHLKVVSNCLHNAETEQDIKDALHMIEELWGENCLHFYSQKLTEHFQQKVFSHIRI